MGSGDIKHTIRAGSLYIIIIVLKVLKVAT